MIAEKRPAWPCSARCEGNSATWHEVQMPASSIRSGRTPARSSSRRFARALVESTLEGQTLYRDAFRMLGVKKTETFNNIGREVGVMG